MTNIQGLIIPITQQDLYEHNNFMVDFLSTIHLRPYNLLTSGTFSYQYAILSTTLNNVTHRGWNRILSICFIQDLASVLINGTPSRKIKLRYSVFLNHTFNISCLFRWEKKIPYIIESTLENQEAFFLNLYFEFPFAPK